MATIGHIAAGFAAGRAFCEKGASTHTLVKAMLGFSALSMAPDLDVIAFALKIPYEAPYGHRGATHSIGAALLVGALTWILAPLLKVPRRRTAIVAFFVVLSHAILDCFTNGGLGCALLWPVSNARFFAPDEIAQIPVAPIGLGMLSLRGMLVLVVETLLFLPVFIYATFPRKRPKPS